MGDHIFNNSLNYDDKIKEFIMNTSPFYFHQYVIPNDEITFNVHYLNNVKSVYKFQGEAKKGSIKVCEAKFSAMITNRSSDEIF